MSPAAETAIKEEIATALVGRYAWRDGYAKRDVMAAIADQIGVAVYALQPTPRLSVMVEPPLDVLRPAIRTAIEMVVETACECGDLIAMVDA